VLAYGAKQGWFGEEPKKKVSDIEEQIKGH
jgi:hypothetical protein